MSKLDMIGYKHKNGLLTVISEDGHIGKERAFICQCDCGSPPVRVSMASLRSGNTRSCGCLPVGRPPVRKEPDISRRSKYDLTNQVFGKLTVIKHLGSDHQRQSIWLCQCQCGNLKEVKTYYLKRKIKHSCGCVRPNGNPYLGKTNRITSAGTGVKGVASRISGNSIRYLSYFDRKGTRYYGPSRHSIDEAVEDRKGLEVKYRLAGDRYGQLEVLCLSDRVSSNNTRLWECKCHACGSLTYVLAASLRAGHYKSCGCIRAVKRDHGLKEHIKADRVDGTRKSSLTSKLHKNNKSGVKGVVWMESRQEWKAYIGFKGKQITLGYRKEKEQAIALRKEAENKYHKPYLEGNE